MGARGRLWVAPYLALALVITGVVVFALRAEGYQTHRADLNDGGVWVTNSALGYYGRVNKPIGQLDGALFARADATLDIVQDGAAVVGVDVAGGTASTIDPSSVAVPSGSTAQVPVGGQVAMDGGTLASLDPGTGKVWAVRVDTDTGDPAVGGIDTSGKPLATVGADAAMTVTESGRIVLAAAGSDRLTTLTPDGDSYDRSTATLDHQPGKGLSLTAVGDRVVLLDPATSTLTVVGGGHATIDKGAVLQQPGPDADSVLVADSSRLVSVALDDGSTTVLSHDLAGSPAAPVRLGSCDYGAWGGGAAGLVVTRCGSGAAQVGQLGAGATGSLVFRVNRGQIVLNDPSTGAVWSVDDQRPTRLDDWQSFQKKVVQRKKDDKQQTKTSGDRTPPKAQPDHFGARPGRTTVLHPLDNDAAPAGRLLAISSVQDVRPAGARVSVSPDGQTVEITMPARPAATTTFEYYINDGQQGGAAHASVTVTARGAGVNQPPALRKGYQDPSWNVPVAGVLTMPVLADWRDDADGDPLSLANARVVSGPAGTVARVTSSGQVRFTAADRGGDATVEYGVSDGIAQPVEHQIHVNVQGPTDHTAHPATAEPDVIVGQAGKPITIHPLDNDLPGSDPINPDAELKLAGKVTSSGGGQVQTDVGNGTVTFRSDQPKTYFLDYDAAFGNARFSRGRIRVDVRAADHPPKAPVAMPDSLTVYGQSAAMVDVLANDVDPAGQVLVVQGAQATTTGQLDVAVINGRWVRIAATRPSISPNPQVVHYTISDGDRSGIQGDIVVSQRPLPADDTPVTQGDQVTVRAGSGTQVSVLDNDFSPDGEQLHLVTDPGADSSTGAGQLTVDDPSHTPGAVGHAYVSGKTVRFNAPPNVTDPTTETVTYVAANERGVTAPGTLRVTILPAKSPNQPPEPTVLEGRVVAGDQVRISLPPSGIDPDGDPVSITGISSPPTLGRVLRAGADSLVYQAFPDSAGTDNFTYTVADARGATATGTVRVGVVPPAMPAAPVAVDDTATVAPGRTMTVDVLANDEVAATDKVTVALVRPAPSGVTVDADTGAMRIKAPAHADGREIQVNYSITDGLQSSQATVTLRTQAGYDNPPVVDDAYGTDAAGGASAARVSVDVLKDAYDPDGPTSALKVAEVETPPGISAQIHGGTVTIDRATTSMVVPFVVTDADGGEATARLYVPPKGNATPYVDSDAMITLDPGQDLQAQLNDYVVNPSRGQVRFTLKDRIWAAPAADVSASITGNGTFTVHADKDYQGPGAVSFEVTTGKTTAILTVPVQVGKTKPVLRCPSDPIPVAQGQRINIDVGAVCHVWTTEPNGSLTYSADWKTSATGLSIIQAQGSQISVFANGTTPAGTSALLQLRAGDSDPAEVPIRVVAVPPPTLAPITIADLKAGQSRTIDLAPYLHAGVPMPQPQVLSATQTSALDVHASPHGSSVTLSSGSKAHGAATFRVVMSDVAGHPPANRTVEGRLTVSLQAAPDAPSAPHPGKVDSGQVALSWNAPPANGSPITAYQVRASHGGPTVRCPTTACTVTGLRNGVDYTFQVRAINAVGPSDWSPSSTVANPDARPLPVTGVTESAVGDGSLTLRWNRPANYKQTSALTYLVSYGGGASIKTSKTSATISGLSNDDTYVFYITATNAKGWSSEPTPSATYQSVGAPGKPAVPTITTTPSADSTAVVTVSWNSVDPNGPGPVRYRVIATPYADGGACTQDPQGISGTSCTFSDIAYDGTTYTFKVEAIAPGTGTGIPGGQSRTTSGATRSWKAVGLPGEWGDWSLDPTGKNNQAVVHGFTVPPSHGGTSTFKIYRGSQVVYTSSNPPSQVDVDTPDNDGSYDFHLEVCNENKACSKSSTKSVTTYGPLDNSDIRISEVDSGQWDVGWNVSVDNNGKAGADVEIKSGGKVLKSCTMTQIDQETCSLPPRYIGYSNTESVTATISQNGRGSGSTGSVRSNATADPSVKISRGAACTTDEGSDPECGHARLDLSGYGDGTGGGSTGGSSNVDWTCDVRAPGTGGLLGSDKVGTATGSGDGTDTSVVVNGYDGDTITVSCTDHLGGATATDSMQWPNAPSANSSSN